MKGTPAFLFWFVMVPVPAMAAMGASGLDGGLIPADIGSVQAFSSVSQSPSAVYYNPAALVGENTKEILVGGSQFRYDDLVFSTDITAPTVSFPPAGYYDLDSRRPLVFGGLTRLSERFRLYGGMLVSVEQGGKKVLSFNADTSHYGRLMRQGNAPLMVAGGFGIKLVRFLDLGVAAQSSLKADAQLAFETNLGGHTRYEQISVDGELTLSSIAGARLDVGSLFCRYVCGGGRMVLAYSWREGSQASMTTRAHARIPGITDDLPLVFTTMDSWQPEISSVALYASVGWLDLAVASEQQQWSAANQLFATDVVRDQAGIVLQDTTVVRVGMGVRFSDQFRMILGYAHEESPLVSLTSPDVNYLDPELSRYGIGFEYLLKYSPGLPVKISAAYQYLKFEDAEIDLHATEFSGGASVSYGNAQVGGSSEIYSFAVSVAF